MSDLALGNPGGAIVRLLKDSLSPGTWKAYGKAWETWERWSSRLEACVDDGEMILVLLLGHFKEEGWSVSQVNRFIACLAYGLRLRGLTDQTKTFWVR